MTAPDPRVGEIQARLDAATPGPWGWDSDTRRRLKASQDETILRCAALLHPEYRNAAFIAAAPADVAYLLAELADRDEKLAKVEALCAQWRAASITDNSVDVNLRAVTYHIRAAVAAANGGGES